MISFPRLLVTCGFGLAASPLWAADLVVSSEHGALTLRTTTAKLAAWQVAPGQLAVAVPESGRLRVGKLPDGWFVHAVDVPKGLGVMLSSPNPNQTGRWQVVHQGQEWVLTTANAPLAGVKPVTARGTLTATTLALANQRIPLVEVTTRDRSVWKIAFVGKPLAVGDALVGAAYPAEATIEPAAGPATPAPHAAVAAAPAQPEAMQLGSLGALTARSGATPSGTAPRISTMGLRAAPVLSPSLPPAQVSVQAAQVTPSAQVASPRAMGLVRIHQAASLRPIAQPHAIAEDNPSSTFAAQLAQDVYIPGTIVSFQIPEGLKTDLVPPAPVATSDTEPEAEEPVGEPAKELMEKGPAPHTEAPADKAHAEKAVSETEAPHKAEVEPKLRGPVMFPDISGHYASDAADLLQATAETPENSRRQLVARTNLVMFYLAWQRPQEALGVIAAFPKRADGLPQDDLMRLMQGVALLATGQHAPQEVFDQTGPLAPHAALWRAVALSQAERYATAMKAWPTRRGILPAYPSYLRELVQERQVAALVNAGDKETARATVDALVAGYPSDEPVPLALIRWQGIARLGTKDEAEGMRLIAKAAEDMHDPTTAYRAKYDFVTTLMDKGLLSNDQAIRYLTNLWMDWRGDTLERDTMKVLADLYDRQDKPREALTLWQTLVKAFPTMPGMDEIARRMTTTFTRAFDPENPRVYDTLTYMGLYYDFRELVPNDALGDAVQEQMATLLNRAMLYNRSVPILEQQLNLRPLDPAAQGRLVLLLAEAYTNLGRGGDALQLLDNWEKVATTTALKEQWKVEETRVLTALNRPQSAAKALKGTPLPEANAEARDALVEASWASGDFSASVPLLKAQLAGLKTSDIVSSTAAQLALFRLGFAYSQLHEGEKLNALNTSYAEALAKLPMVSDGLGAVAASSSLSATVPTGGPLAPISTALNDLNTLTANVKLTRADVQQHNESIQEFDKKMRYMELLPPPAI